MSHSNEENLHGEFPVEGNVEESKDYLELNKIQNDNADKFETCQGLEENSNNNFETNICQEVVQDINDEITRQFDKEENDIHMNEKCMFSHSFVVEDIVNKQEYVENEDCKEINQSNFSNIENEYGKNNYQDVQNEVSDVNLKTNEELILQDSESFISNFSYECSSNVMNEDEINNKIQTEEVVCDISSNISNDKELNNYSFEEQTNDVQMHDLSINFEENQENFEQNYTVLAHDNQYETNITSQSLVEKDLTENSEINNEIFNLNFGEVDQDNCQHGNNEVLIKKTEKSKETKCENEMDSQTNYIYQDDIDKSKEHMENLNKVCVDLSGNVEDTIISSFKPIKVPVFNLVSKIKDADQLKDTRKQQDDDNITNQQNDNIDITHKQDDDITNQQDDITNQQNDDDKTNQQDDITNQQDDITNQQDDITNQQDDITNQQDDITKQDDDNITKYQNNNDTIKQQDYNDILKQQNYIIKQQDDNDIIKQQNHDITKQQDADQIITQRVDITKQLDNEITEIPKQHDDILKQENDNIIKQQDDDITKRQDDDVKTKKNDNDEITTQHDDISKQQDNETLEKNFIDEIKIVYNDEIQKQHDDDDLSKQHNEDNGITNKHDDITKQQCVDDKEVDIYEFLLDYNVDEMGLSQDDDKTIKNAHEITKPSSTNKPNDKKLQIDTNIENSTWQAVSAEKGFFYEKAGCDLKIGYFSRIIITGDHFVKVLSDGWRSKSEIKPYFLSSDNFSINYFFNAINNHSYLKNCDGKILVIAIMGMHDLFPAKQIKSRQCTSKHSPIIIPVKSFSSSKRIPFKVVNEFIDTKKKLEQVHNNVHMVYSYIPIVTLSAAKMIMHNHKAKYKKCTCGHLSTRIELKKMNHETKILINSVNQQIFSYKLTDLPDYKFFTFTPLYIDFFSNCWTTKDNDDLLENVVQLEECLKVAIHCTDIGYKVKFECVNNKENMLVYIIGDSWLEAVFHQSMENRAVQPKFYFDSHMTLQKLRKIILGISFTNKNTLVITSVNVNDLVDYISHRECVGHDPLWYSIPKVQMLKDPENFATKILDSISDMKDKIYKYRNNLKIAFMTCYPLVLKMFCQHLFSIHALETNHKIHNQLIQAWDCDLIDINRCIETINAGLISKNRTDEVQTCGIYYLIRDMARKNDCIFPVFIPEKSPPPLITVEMTALIYEYIEKLNIQYNKEKLFKNYIVYDCLLNEPCNEEEKEGEDTVNNSKSLLLVSKHEKNKKEIDSNKTVRTKHSKEHNLTKDRKEHRNKHKEDGNRHKELNKHREDKEQSGEHKESNDEEKNRSSHSKREHKRSNDSLRSRIWRSKSRSQHRRSRSRVRDSRNRSHYRRSKSRGHRSRSRGSRSRSRGRRSRSRGRRSRSLGRTYRSRGRRSRSRGHKSRSRSYEKRSRSRKHSDSRKRSPSYLGLSSSETEAINNLWKVHSRECDMYRANPYIHPDHDRVRRMWLNIMTSQGLNNDISESAWMSYWCKKMENLFDESWKDKKSQCMRLLLKRSSRRSSSHSSSSSSSNSSHSRKRKKRKKSKEKKKKQQKISKETEPSINVLKPEEFKPMDKLEFRISNFIEKSQKTLNTEKTQQTTIPQNFNSLERLQQKLVDATSVLFHLVDKFGALGISVKLLHQNVLDAVSHKSNPLEFIDDDAKILLDLLKDKLSRIKEDPTIKIVQRAIIEEAYERLSTFLVEFEQKRDPYLGLDINIIAKVTRGKGISDIIAFINNALTYKEVESVTEDDVAQIYLAIKNIHDNMPDESLCSKYPTESTGYSNKTEAFPSSSYPSTSSGICSLKEKTDFIRHRFMSLPMSERVKKFYQFKSLPFEEKSFLIGHLEELEKTDSGLAQSLRCIIMQSKNQ